MPSTMSNKLKTLFEDLGKPTLRGVRKCPKCGTYNGTRGISCKNKTCDVVFKEVSEKKKLQSADAVKIITGSSSKVFSVRVRDRGPDYRSFVQLPMVSNLDPNAPPTLDSTVDVSQTAKCYIETCRVAVGGSENTCTHIKSALSCFSEATPLTLKNSVLNSLNVSTETKQAIWLLATETTGPLVQRVSKNIMVVKCKPHPKQPLGFLHFAFFETSRNRELPEHKFQCSCRAFKNYKIGLSKEECQKRCVHFYACVCAFASDDKLSEEFSFYISLDSTGEGNDSNSSIVTCAYDSAPERRLVSIFNEVQQLPDVEVVIQDNREIVTTKTKKRKKDDSLAQASSALLTLQDSGAPAAKKSPTKKAHPLSCIRTGIIPIDETQVSITFQQWLSSITERINQTMHYQFDGKPEPLVFHVPQVFFDCLQQRISAGSKKKRLPNSTTGFVRRDALPIGTFSKYTWHITNVLHVKQIFETAEVTLEVTRSFVENRDGTYDLYGAPKVQVESIAEAYRKNENQPLIKPFELKTYLKVGHMSPDQKDPTPFIIEWIPDVLPKMKVGELRIKFEYGHQRNGHVELRAIDPPSSASKS